MAVSEAQKRANEKYAKTHPKETRYRKTRSATRSFIRNRSTLDDLEELRLMIVGRGNKLKHKDLS